MTTGRNPATGRSQQRSFTHHGDQDSAVVRQRDLVELYGMRVLFAPPPTAAMTVRELLDAFLADSHRWSPTTWRSHTGHIHMLLRDRLAAARLDRLTPATVERAIARWVHGGAKAAVIVGRFAVLHSAITWALDNKLILSDPLASMHAPSRPHPRLHLRPGEVRQLILAADAAVEQARALLAEHPDRRHHQLALFRAEQNALLVRLAADSGARRGELTALYTTDLHSRVLGIRRASQDGVIGSVKNHRQGGLTLTTNTTRYWTHHVTTWTNSAPMTAESSGDAENVDEVQPRWLFRATPEATTPLLPNGLGQRFDTLARAAGLPEATLHRLRHTVGTYLVAQGKILQACARLRHRDVATTLRNYAHALPLNDNDVADTLEHLYGLDDFDTVVTDLRRAGS